MPNRWIEILDIHPDKGGMTPRSFHFICAFFYKYMRGTSSCIGECYLQNIACRPEREAIPNCRH